MSIPIPHFIPPTPSPLISVYLFSTSVHLFLFTNKLICTIFLDSPYMFNIWDLLFSFWLISLCMTVSRSIHVSANGTVSFLLWLNNIPRYSHSTCTTWRSVCFHRQLVSESRFTFSSGVLALANLCVLILFPNPSQESSLLPQRWIKFNDCQYDIHVIALSDTEHKWGLNLPLSFEKRTAKL